MTGFEPATSASRTQRSTKLSHIPTGRKMLPQPFAGPDSAGGLASFGGGAPWGIGLAAA
jgi:hypothetical protein